MSLKSFWNEPVFGDEPAAEKAEKRRKRSVCFRWTVWLAVILIVGGISELIDKIRTSEHSTLIFSLIGVGLRLQSPLSLFLLYAAGKIRVFNCKFELSKQEIDLGYIVLWKFLLWKRKRMITYTILAAMNLLLLRIR